MANALKTRGTSLVSALLATAFFAACQDTGPTEVPSDLDVLSARGGNGGGGNGGGNGGGGDGGGDDPPTPLTLTLSGGMSGGVFASDAGQIGTDSSREVLFSGQPFFSSDCDVDGPGTDALCFMSELALETGVAGLVFNSGTQDMDDMGACEMTDRKMTTKDAYPLLALLDDDSQARFMVQGRVNKKKANGALNIDWYEGDGDPNRYRFGIASPQADEIRDNAGALLSVTYTNAVISIYGTGFSAIECTWIGTITAGFGAS